MPLKSFGKPTSRSLSHNGTVHPDRPAHSSNRQNQSVDISFSTVDIAPNRAVTGGSCVEGVPRSMLRRREVDIRSGGKSLSRVVRTTHPDICHVFLLRPRRASDRFQREPGGYIVCAT